MKSALDFIVTNEIHLNVSWTVVAWIWIAFFWSSFCFYFQSPSFPHLLALVIFTCAFQWDKHITCIFHFNACYIVVYCAQALDPTQLNSIFINFINFVVFSYVQVAYVYVFAWAKKSIAFNLDIRYISVLTSSKQILPEWEQQKKNQFSSFYRFEVEVEFDCI